MSNWPNNKDLSAYKWSNKPYGVYIKTNGYRQMNDKIPLSAWIGGAVVLALIFGYVPLLYVFMGN